MISRLREFPPVCMLTALVDLFLGRLWRLQNYLDEVLEMDDGSEYRVFRNISRIPHLHHPENVVFIVTFRFARLSDQANRIVSKLPMLLIAGFPGFLKKIYAVNTSNGHWMGMYQWKNQAFLEKYKKSFVFRMMNKRAVPGSVRSFEYPHSQLEDFINEHDQSYRFILRHDDSILKPGFNHVS